MLSFNGSKDITTIAAKWPSVWQQFHQFAESFQPLRVKLNAFEQYSAKEVTKQLADLLDQVTAV